MINAAAYTTLETLFLCQWIKNHGLEAFEVAAFSQISAELATNLLVQANPTFDATRLNPRSLQEFFLHLLQEELKDVNGPAETVDPSGSLGSRKRKLQTPVVTTLKEAKAHVDKLPVFVEKLYGRYKDEVVASIEEEEKQYAELQEEILALELQEEQGKATSDNAAVQQPNGVATQVNGAYGQPGPDAQAVAVSETQGAGASAGQELRAPSDMSNLVHNGTAIAVAQQTGSDAVSAATSGAVPPLAWQTPYQPARTSQQLPQVPQHSYSQSVDSAAQNVPTAGQYGGFRAPQPYAAPDAPQHGRRGSLAGPTGLAPPSRARKGVSDSQSVPTTPYGHAGGYGVGIPTQMAPRPFGTPGPASSARTSYFPTTPYTGQYVDTPRGSGTRWKSAVQTPSTPRPEVGGVASPQVEPLSPVLKTRRLEAPSAAAGYVTQVKNEVHTPDAGFDASEVADANGVKRKRQDSEVSATRSAAPASPTHVSWTRGFLKISASALDQISEHKNANMFARGLSDHDAPDYNAIVHDPVHLKSIRKMIKDGNTNAIAAAKALPGGDPGGSAIWLPLTDKLIFPQAIINSTQLESALTRMCANAIMYNPDPRRGFGRYFLRSSGDAGDDRDEDGNTVGYHLDENSVVNGALALAADVEKIMASLRTTEAQPDGPPPPLEDEDEEAAEGSAVAGDNEGAADAMDVDHNSAPGDEEEAEAEITVARAASKRRRTARA